MQSQVRLSLQLRFANEDGLPGAFDQTDDPFVIGVLGQKPFGQVLDEIARRKRLSGRRIVIRRFQSMKEYKPCHILYVTSTVPPEKARAITQKLRRSVRSAGRRNAGLRNVWWRHRVRDRSRQRQVQSEYESSASKESGRHCATQSARDTELPTRRRQPSPDRNREPPMKQRHGSLSIRVRLTLLAVVSSGVAILVACGAFAFHDIRVMQTARVAQLRTQAEMLAFNSSGRASV